MSRVLVIGCGGVASVAIQKCCQVDEVFTEMCIASRTKEKCDALVEKLKGKTKTVLTTARVDADDADQVLEGAEFELFNQTLDISCEKQVTDEKGKAQFSSQPIGYLDQEGKFSPYDYLVKETKAAPGHMLSEKTLEFQFEYKDEKTPLIELTYDPVNDSNRVLVKKLLRDTEEYLEGAVLRLEREEKVILEPDERGDQGESQKKDQKKYQAKDQMKEEKTWVVVETWITGKQPHLKALQPGITDWWKKRHRLDLRNQKNRCILPLQME